MLDDFHEIETMFRSLDGRDQYEAAIEKWVRWRLFSDARNKREWRKTNRSKARASKQKYYDTHREHMREVWRRNAKAYRARKRAMKGSQG